MAAYIKGNQHLPAYISSFHCKLKRRLHGCTSKGELSALLKRANVSKSDSVIELSLIITVKPLVRSFHSDGVWNPENKDCGITKKKKKFNQIN